MRHYLLFYEKESPFSDAAILPISDQEILYCFVSAFSKSQNKGKLLAVWLLPNTSDNTDIVYCVTKGISLTLYISILTYYRHIFSAIFQNFLYFVMGHYLLFYGRECLISDVVFLY